MTKKVFWATVLSAILPSFALAAGQGQSGFNWGTIVGSVIVGLIFCVAIMVEHTKHDNNKGGLFRPIDTSGIKKFFKNALIILILFIAFNSFITPILIGQASKNINLKNLLSIILAIITLFLYKKIIVAKNGKK